MQGPRLRLSVLAMCAVLFRLLVPTPSASCQKKRRPRTVTTFKASPKRIYEALMDTKQFDKITQLSGAMQSMHLSASRAAAITLRTSEGSMRILRPILKQCTCPDLIFRRRVQWEVRRTAHACSMSSNGSKPPSSVGASFTRDLFMRK
jgi:hypothetical protein